ncbi:MAG: hypothetical protein ACLQIQ_04400 [Beijerinckiaceae bacterium]
MEFKPDLNVLAVNNNRVCTDRLDINPWSLVGDHRIQLTLHNGLLATQNMPLGRCKDGSYDNRGYGENIKPKSSAFASFNLGLSLILKSFSNASAKGKFGPLLPWF